MIGPDGKRGWSHASFLVKVRETKAGADASGKAGIRNKKATRYRGLRDAHPVGCLDSAKPLNVDVERFVANSRGGGRQWRDPWTAAYRNGNALQLGEASGGAGRAPACVQKLLRLIKGQPVPQQ